MKRTNTMYWLVTALGVALGAAGLLNAQAHILPLTASKVMVPLGASPSALASGTCSDRT